jgi:hypothetical protein
MAGLPGTGLGGIFYILLVVWAIIRQSVQPGRYADWRQVLPLGAMAAAIILVLWCEVWAIGSFVGRMPKLDDLMSAPTSGVLGTVLALTPVLSLAMLLCALHIARLLVPREAVSPR